MVICVERGDWWQVWEFKCTGRKVARLKCGKKWIWEEPLVRCEKTEWQILLLKMKRLDNRLKNENII